MKTVRRAKIERDLELRIPWLKVRTAEQTDLTETNLKQFKLDQPLPIESEASTLIDEMRIELSRLRAYKSNLKMAVEKLCSIQLHIAQSVAATDYSQVKVLTAEILSLMSREI